MAEHINPKMWQVGHALILLLTVLGTSSVGQADPSFWRHEWPETDFSKASIPFIEIMSGGPPKDGIPAIDDPMFAPVAETELPGVEPVLTFEAEGVPARAYPLRYLTWHEIVNDEVAGVPVAVTFCPLCNSAMVFDRRTTVGVLSFGVSGKLRHSDMIMYDRETQSWWQQAMGEAVVGEMTGTQLLQLPSRLESWDNYRARRPDGLVMAQPDFQRDYGRNPYRGYDSAARPFLYSGEAPPHGVAALERVVRVGTRAWPLRRVREDGVIKEAGLQIIWQAGQASALDDGTIAKGRHVGDIQVLDGDGHDLPHDVMFAFAFDAFWPDGIWMIEP